MLLTGTFFQMRKNTLTEVTYITGALSYVFVVKIFKLVDEVTAENIEILHDVVQDQFVVVFEVKRQTYRFQVPDTRQLPLDLDSSSIQELIVEIKLRHF